MEKKTSEPSPASSEQAPLHALLAALEAAAQGSFTRLPVQGTDSLTDKLARAFNALGDQVSALTTEVGRVTTEVGTQGRLGGQAQLPGVSGTWKDLISHVNRMAAVHTEQLRDLARVAGAVAKGDLSQKITVEAGGEALELKLTVNTMVDQLSAFAAEVTRVAKEVGPEGKRGNQPVSCKHDGRLERPVRERERHRTAGARLPVQERVPGQHEPRAAHAAQQPAHPGQRSSRRTRRAA